MTVPPVGGPESGEILVIVGAGQLVNVVVREPGHSSPTLQLDPSLHQAQSKPVSVLAARQTEQMFPKSSQSYSKATEMRGGDK